LRPTAARADLAGIQVPMFVVGTETDHVAPWKSVYKARGLTRSADYTFLLTSRRPQCRASSAAPCIRDGATVSVPG